MSALPLHFHLLQFGQVLATRAKGQEVARALSEGAVDQQDLIIDFKDIAALTPPFLDELFDAIRLILNRNDGATTVIAVNLDDDLLDSIELVLEKRGFPLAWQEEDRVELIAAAPHLRETLVAAAAAKDFTATDLAERLRLQPTTVNQRLAALLEAGVVAREREPSDRGVRYRYRTARKITAAS